MIELAGLTLINTLRLASPFLWIVFFIRFYVRSFTKIASLIVHSLMSDIRLKNMDVFMKRHIEIINSNDSKEEKELMIKELECDRKDDVFVEFVLSGGLHLLVRILYLFFGAFTIAGTSLFLRNIIVTLFV